MADDLLRERNELAYAFLHEARVATGDVGLHGVQKTFQHRRCYIIDRLRNAAPRSVLMGVQIGSGLQQRDQKVLQGFPLYAEVDHQAVVAVWFLLEKHRRRLRRARPGVKGVCYRGKCRLRGAMAPVHRAIRGHGRQNPCIKRLQILDAKASEELSFPLPVRGLRVTEYGGDMRAGFSQLLGGESLQRSGGVGRDH